MRGSSRQLGQSLGAVPRPTSLGGPSVGHRSLITVAVMQM